MYMYLNGSNASLHIPDGYQSRETVYLSTPDTGCFLRMSADSWNYAIIDTSKIGDKTKFEIPHYVVVNNSYVKTVETLQLEYSFERTNILIELQSSSDTVAAVGSTSSIIWNNDELRGLYTDIRASVLVGTPIQDFQVVSGIGVRYIGVEEGETLFATLDLVVNREDVYKCTFRGLLSGRDCARIRDGPGMVKDWG